MVVRWTHAALAFALAIIVTCLAVPRAELAVDSDAADAIGVTRGSIQHAKRVEGARVARHAPRAVHAATPPPGVTLAIPHRTSQRVSTEAVAPRPRSPSPRAARARGPPA